MPRMQTLDVCVLVVWGLVVSSSSAERQYFPQNKTNSWVAARKYCQRCFRELVTLTPENNQNIAKGLSSEHWIGLRKRPVHASDNSYLYPDDNTTFWSQWANEDPLSFQNWYPGYPVFKSPYPRKDCCSCSCTCPAQPITGPTTVKPTTGTATESVCVRNPMQFQGVPDPDENYIEDPCVAMLSFGAWVERNCTEFLPFICYEDRFYGEVNVTDITNSTAKLKWEEGPGDNLHYRVEVNGSVQKVNQTELTDELKGLEPGTLYSVQVFPVKCGRDLNPQNRTFYTVPNKVTDLKVVNQTENCVSLNWTRPQGKVDLYTVETKELKTPKKPRTEVETVCDLTPGSQHTFTVRSGVNDHSQRSEESTIDAYTKPAKVSNLRTSDITDTSLVLSWDAPQGSVTGYNVITSWDGKLNATYTNKTVEKRLELKDLPSGTKITLTVTALANNVLQGEKLTVVCFTKPKDITELNLTSTNDRIVAIWSFTKGSPTFIVELFLGKVQKDTIANISTTNCTFYNLSSAANYTVTVFSVIAQNRSSGFSKSIFTQPNPPQNVQLSGKNKTHLTFTWSPPRNTVRVHYLVNLMSRFWGQNFSKTLDDRTMYTFENLTSGTKYTFQVQTKAGKQLSEPANLTAATDPVKRQITLSMVCSSHIPLHCDKNDTRNSTFQKLKFEFQEFLGDNIFWNLEKMDTPNTGD